MPKEKRYLTIEEKCNRYTINDNGCWIWKGWKNKDGYGCTMINGREERIHRVAWEFWNNKKIPENMTIDHICFQRDCINPEHLRLATWEENRSRHKYGNGRTVSMWCEKHKCEKIAVSWGKKNPVKSYCKQCQHERYLAKKALGKYSKGGVYYENRRNKK